MGIIPLILFLARLRHFLVLGEPGQILWVCHMSNLILSIGLFLNQSELVRVAVLWLILGLPLWIWGMTHMGIGTLSTFGTHFGGFVVGMFAFSRIGGGRKTWLYSLLWFLLLQQVCRVFTQPELNVNLAHRIYKGWESVFGAYWKYWAVNIILAGISLWIIGFILRKLWPPQAIGASNSARK